jgi:hypothetical protein
LLLAEGWPASLAPHMSPAAIFDRYLIATR